MPLTDVSRDSWIKDISALLNISPSASLNLHSTLKNLACHLILEQYFQDPDRDFFEINVAPYGMATLVRTDEGWDIKDFRLYPSFLATLEETLRCKESNLYRESSERVYKSLSRKLNQFSYGYDSDN